MSYENIDDSGRIIRTRKTFSCEWCCGTINPRDYAVIRVYKWHGELNNGRQHPECYTAMNESIMNDELDDDNGFVSGDAYRGQTIFESINNEE